jgi:hypothetical protein
MRPAHPDWNLHFESEIAPMVATKIMFPLVEEAHIYLTAIQGDGALFSGDFRKCWEKLPTKDRETLIRHWNTAAPVLQTLPHLPYITLVDELISKNKVKSGVVAGTTMDKGFLIEFWAPVIMRMPTDISQTVVAHELAHVLQFSMHEDPVAALGIGKMEAEADLQVEKWGYSMTNIEKWAFSISNNRPKTDQALQALIEASREARHLDKEFPEVL